MVTLVEAIKNKYEDFDDSGSFCIVLTGSPTKGGGGKLCLSNVLIMDSQEIKKIGDKSALKSMANISDITEIDLTNNNIESWEEVYNLLECTSGLLSLNLSHNPLYKAPSKWPSFLSEMGVSFPSLSTLILNSTRLTWSHLINVLKLAPNLQILYLCLNEMNEILPGVSFPSLSAGSNNNCIPNIEERFSPYHTLKHLYFNQNGVQHWSQIVRLGQMFPNLEMLIAIDNLIEEIPPCASINSDNNDDESIYWSCSLMQLNTLNLSHNLIQDWNSLDNLRALPSLQELKILGLPFYKDWSMESVWNHTIARLPYIKRLNSSLIDPEERERAERDFIRYYMEKPASDRPRRYYELEALHGKLEKLAEVDLTPKESVLLQIRYDGQTQLHSLVVSQTIGELKRDLCRLYDLPRPSLFKFVYVDHVMGPDELQYNGRMFHAYKPEDGEEIIIYKKK